MTCVKRNWAVRLPEVAKIDVPRREYLDRDGESDGKRPHLAHTMKSLSEFVPLGSYGTGLSQANRLITVVTAQERELPEALIAEQFVGREAINELFRFDIDALSVSTDLDLSTFVGEDLTLTLSQPDGTRRAWHGICTESSWLGADGGVARYRLRLEPALALLAHRRDSYIFQDKNARDIVIELMADYPQVRLDFDITQELAVRPVCTQYRESDLEFFVRLLASEGLNWRFEHDQAADDGNGHAAHRIVIFDSRARAPATAGGDHIRFHNVFSLARPCAGRKLVRIREIYQDRRDPRRCS